MITIKIIAGSTRPNRFNIQPANWILDQAKQRTDCKVELLDLSQIDLPMYNEPVSPAQGQYKYQHTKDWSKKVKSADAFIIVTPEYNHSIPAALKNALDYLYHEWNYKPVSFISYGSLAGGARSVEHLRGISGELKMYDLREQILFPNYWNHTDEEGDYNFTQAHEKQAQAILDDLIFWAETMKKARTKLSQ